MDKTRAVIGSGARRDDGVKISWLESQGALAPGAGEGGERMDNGGARQ